MSIVGNSASMARRTSSPTPTTATMSRLAGTMTVCWMRSERSGVSVMPLKGKSRSARGPRVRAAAEDVRVQVTDLLAAETAVVDDDAVPAGQPLELAPRGRSG